MESFYNMKEKKIILKNFTSIIAIVEEHISKIINEILTLFII